MFILDGKKRKNWRAIRVLPPTTSTSFMDLDTILLQLHGKGFTAQRRYIYLLQANTTYIWSCKKWQNTVKTKKHE